ncbi:MAG: hypothetical protein KatS3mg035_0817 [Bacteroidia bacterium]|nr:MAG: hypothetical protein KatS3mg035_0817 [Bacteroidia bacterium]
MDKQKTFLFFLLLLLFYQSYAFDVKIRVLMEGPLQGSSMSTLLVNELKKHHAQTPNDAVDIVQVEIRTSLQSQPIETQKAFLLKDGSLVSYSSLQPTIRFNASGSSYYVVVKHRNHLPLASKNLVAHQSVCDLTLPQNIFGETKIIQGKAVMIAGNVFNDNGDVNEINASDFYHVSKAKDNRLSGYVVEDVNLDGVVNEKDFDIVKNHADKLYFSQIQ